MFGCSPCPGLTAPPTGCTGKFTEPVVSVHVALPPQHHPGTPCPRTSQHCEYNYVRSVSNHPQLFFFRPQSWRRPLFAGRVGTPRRWESSARFSAGHSSDFPFSAHCPPALLLGVASTREGGGDGGHNWPQPAPPTHGAAGAEPQSSGSVFQDMYFH